MSNERSLPRYAKAFATVTTVLSALALPPAMGIPVIVALVGIPNLVDQKMSTLEIMGAVAIFLLLIAYAVFYLVWLRSSIGLLRHKPAALSTYRACLLVFLSLGAVAFVVQLASSVAFPVFSPGVLLLVEAVIFVFGALVGYLCIKMLRQLRQPTVMELFVDA